MERPKTELNWDEETLIYVDDLEFQNKELESQLKEREEETQNKVKLILYENGVKDKIILSEIEMILTSKTK